MHIFIVLLSRKIVKLGSCQGINVVTLALDGLVAQHVSDRNIIRFFCLLLWALGFYVGYLLLWQRCKKNFFLGIHNERIIVSKADDIRIRNPSCPEMVHLLALDVRHSKSRIFGSEMNVVKLKRLNTSILPQISFYMSLKNKKLNLYSYGIFHWRNGIFCLHHSSQIYSELAQDIHIRHLVWDL